MASPRATREGSSAYRGEDEGIPGWFFIDDDLTTDDRLHTLCLPPFTAAHMTHRPVPHIEKTPAHALPQNLDREAMLLLVYFRALSLEHQDLTVKLLRALQETKLRHLNGSSGAALGPMQATARDMRS